MSDRRETSDFYPDDRQPGRCPEKVLGWEAHLEDFDNPHRVTAEQVGSLAETVIRRLVEAAARGAVDEAKAYADLLVSGLLRICGVVDTVEDLPDVAVNGNVYIVRADSSEYLWLEDTQRWERLGPILDLSGYATTAVLKDGLSKRLYASGIQYGDDGKYTGNLNALTRGGVYYVTAAASNRPEVDVGGVVLVAHPDDDSWVAQTFIATGAASTDPDNQGIYLRAYTGGAWTAWKAANHAKIGAVGLEVTSSGYLRAKVDTAMPAMPEDTRMPSTKLLKTLLDGYLPLTGGTVTGDTIIMGTRFTNNGWLFASNIAEGGLWISAKYASKEHTHDAADVASGTLNATRLPVATAGIRGAVACGDGLKMGGNANAVMSVKPATASSIGGVKVGDGLSVTADGTLSAEGGLSMELTHDTAASILKGSESLSFDVVDDGKIVEMAIADGSASPTLRRLATQAYVDTAVATGGSGESLRVIDESQYAGMVVNGVRADHDTEVYPFIAGQYLGDADPQNAFAVRADGTPGVYIDLDWHPFTADLFAGKSYTLPVAGASTLGGVKVGEGLSALGDGTLSVAYDCRGNAFIDAPEIHPEAYGVQIHDPNYEYALSVALQEGKDHNTAEYVEIGLSDGRSPSEPKPVEVPTKAYVDALSKVDGLVAGNEITGQMCLWLTPNNMGTLKVAPSREEPYPLEISLPFMARLTNAIGEGTWNNETDPLPFASKEYVDNLVGDISAALAAI